MMRDGTDMLGAQKSFQRSQVEGSLRLRQGQAAVTMAGRGGGEGGVNRRRLLQRLVKPPWLEVEIIWSVGWGKGRWGHLDLAGGASWALRE